MGGMTEKSTRQSRRKAAGLIIGRTGFAQISKVEGIALPKGAKADLRRYDKKNLSTNERRQAIIEKYAKARS
jgi:hypothetical protein